MLTLLAAEVPDRSVSRTRTHAEHLLVDLLNPAHLNLSARYLIWEDSTSLFPVRFRVELPAHIPTSLPPTV